MKGIIRDTGLENLIRVLSKQDPAPPAQNVPRWPGYYTETPPNNAIEKATATSRPPHTSQVLEKGLVVQQSGDTLNGLERGVAKNVVDWRGPDDLEVRSNSGLR